MKTNILFTCSGRRNYLINYFKEALNGNGKIIAVDNQINAPSLIDADIAVQVPTIYSDKYIQTLIEICKTYQVTALISLNDLELPILSKNKEEIEKIGTKVIISNELVIDTSFDKWKTHKFLLNINLLTPKTYIDVDIFLKDLELNKINFPVILKPRWGSASIGIELIESIEEFKLAYKLQKIKLSRSMLNQVSRANIDNAILIQEKINGKEHGVDVLNDFQGKYSGSFIREKLSMRSGETDKAKSIFNTNIEIVAKKISENLGHIGNLDCDVFLDNEKVFVLELNPRFGGGYPFSHEAGINTAAIYIEWLKGNTNIGHLNNYKENISYAKCDRMIKIPN